MAAQLGSPVHPTPPLHASSTYMHVDEHEVGSYVRHTSLHAVASAGRSVGPFVVRGGVDRCGWGDACTRSGCDDRNDGESGGDAESSLGAHEFPANGNSEIRIEVKSVTAHEQGLHQFAAPNS